jgi:hypothetical protein
MYEVISRGKQNETVNMPPKPEPHVSGTAEGGTQHFAGVCQQLISSQYLLNV